MQYNPNDLVEYEPVEEGDYGFVVVNAEDATSQSGNEMIALTLQVDVEGRQEPITVFDQLVNTPKALWVLKSFCHSVSPSIDFEAGELEAANCIGASGTAHLVLGDANKNGRRYMTVGHYVRPKVVSDAPSTSGTAIAPAEESAPQQTSDAKEPAPF